MADPFDLARFVQAQEPVIDTVRVELAAGRKASHWMWFIFPQLAALGRSATARFYGIGSLAEAVAYVRHPVLKPRLMACIGLVNAVQNRSAHAIFGSPDDLKFRSSATLFAHADPDESRFQQALHLYFAGEPDIATLALLGEPPVNPRTG